MQFWILYDEKYWRIKVGPMESYQDIFKGQGGQVLRDEFRFENTKWRCGWLNRGWDWAVREVRSGRMRDDSHYFKTKGRLIGYSGGFLFVICF